MHDLITVKLNIFIFHLISISYQKLFSSLNKYVHNQQLNSLKIVSQTNYFMSIIRKLSKSNYFLFSIMENLIRLEKINKRNSQYCEGKSHFYIIVKKFKNSTKNYTKELQIKKCDLMQDFIYYLQSVHLKKINCKKKSTSQFYFIIELSQ